jgi:hypothetical protein
MSEQRKRASIDELNKMLALMRAAGTTGLTPLSLRTGSEAGGEGLQGARDEGLKVGDEGPKRVRLAVRPDREPTGHTVRLSDVAPEALRWLWPGRIPAGRITLLEGDPGLGKSTLLCELAARISRGEPLPGADPLVAPGAPRGVLLFSAEDDPFDTIRPASMPPVATRGASFPSSPSPMAPTPVVPSPCRVTCPSSTPSSSASMSPSSSSTS